MKMIAVILEGYPWKYLSLYFFCSNAYTMKNINSFLVLFMAFFTCFANAQDSDNLVCKDSCKNIKILIQDNPGINRRNFVISMSNIPNQISQSHGMKLAIYVHNTSSYRVRRNRFRLTNKHIKGLVIDSATCKLMRGGLGGVIIPPLEAGESMLLPIEITIPNNEDGSGRFLQTGPHLFGFWLHKINNHFENVKLKTKTELDLNVFYSKQKNSCSIRSKMTNTMSVVPTYPNPFIDRVHFDISKQNFNAPISLRIYNAKGVLQDFRTYMESKLTALSYTNDTLDSGLYYYKLVSQNKVITGTLVRN